jgi:hypothetical protein
MKSLRRRTSSLAIDNNQPLSIINNQQSAINNQQSTINRDTALLLHG